MHNEINVLLAILENTKNGQGCSIRKIVNITCIQSEAILEVIKKNADIIYLKSTSEPVHVTSINRIKIAIRAIESGADIENTCRNLTWVEFEEMIFHAFLKKGFKVRKHFRFRWNNKGREIDVLALKQPLVLCIECKHWFRNWYKFGSKKAVNRQIKNTSTLAEASKQNRKKIGINQWSKAVFIPVVISLVPSSTKFLNNVPIVPVLQLPDFIQKIFGNLDLFMKFSFVY